MPSPAIVGGLAAALVLLIVVAVLLSGGAKVPTADELLAMTPAELALVAPKTLAKVPFADLVALGTSQKNALVQLQVAALTDPQVDALILALTPQQCGWLRQKQVEGIEVTDVDDVVKDSVLAMLPWLLPIQKQAITEENVSLLGAALVPYLQQLSDRQIRALPNSVVMDLLDDKLRAVAPILKQSQIEALDSRQIGVIADLLSATQVGYVDPRKIAALLGPALRSVATKLKQTQIEALDATKVGVVADLMTETQVGYVSNSTLVALDPDPLYLIATKLSDNQIRANGSLMEKIAERILPLKVGLINPQVIDYLTVSQLYSVAPNLARAQIEAISAAKFGYIAFRLTKEQVGYILPETLSELIRLGVSFTQQ